MTLPHAEPPPASPDRGIDDRNAVDPRDESLATIRQALEGLRFGSISITVHEGRVVQIDVTEKRRFTP
ncbi:MAG: YezD family protein [Sphingobium sp.]